MPSFSNRYIKTDKLEEMFRLGSNSDVRIRYNDRVFNLHKAYLREESDAFKELFKQHRDEYDIRMKYSVSDF